MLLPKCSKVYQSCILSHCNLILIKLSLCTIPNWRWYRMKVSIVYWQCFIYPMNVLNVHRKCIWFGLQWFVFPFQDVSENKHIGWNWVSMLYIWALWCIIYLHVMELPYQKWIKWTWFIVVHEYCIKNKNFVSSYLQCINSEPNGRASCWVD